MLGEGRQQLAVLKKKKKKIEERHQGGHLLHDIHFPASAGQEEKSVSSFCWGKKRGFEEFQAAQLALFYPTEQ